jgi:hypothetical protein
VGARGGEVRPDQPSRGRAHEAGARGGIGVLASWPLGLLGMWVFWPSGDSFFPVKFYLPSYYSYYYVVQNNTSGMFDAPAKL